jgi:hypothetical protein
MEKNIQSELEQLEVQKQQLLEKQKELEKEANYYKHLQRRDEFFIKEKKIIDSNNKKIEDFYYELIGFGVQDYVFLRNRENNITYPSYYNNDLKIEDQPKPISYPSKYIEIDYGVKYKETLYTINDNKIQSYTIVGSYRNVTAKTLATKILEQIRNIQSKKQEMEVGEMVKNGLIKEFTNKYPGCLVEYKSEWVSGYGKYNKGYNTNNLKITFSNTSWIKIRFYNDRSYSIIEKYDHKAPKTKEGWFEYLSK